MTKTEILKELETELNELKRHEARIDFLKLLLAHSDNNVADEQPTNRPNPNKPKSRIEQFIDDRQDEMEPETIEFLRRIEVLPSEVTEFIDEIGQRSVGPDEITRRAKRGIYQPGPSNSTGRRTIDTMSVVKYHFFQGVRPMKPLTQDQLLNELEKALTTQKLAEVRVAMLQTRLQLSGSTLANPSPGRPNRYQAYIDEHGIDDPDDCDLIRRESLTREEAAVALGVSTSTVYRDFQNGDLKQAPNSRTRPIRIDSISVYEYLQNGRPQVAR
jgi:hypothetical protein